MWSLGICPKHLRLYFILSIKSGMPHHLLYGGTSISWDRETAVLNEHQLECHNLLKPETLETNPSPFTKTFKHMPKTTQECLSDNCKCP